VSETVKRQMSRPHRGKVIVFGILFWYPLAGVTFQFLHFMIGLRRLGFEPYYIEDSSRWVYDPVVNDLSPDPTRNIEMVLPQLEAHGFSESWAFRGRYPDGKTHGMSDAAIDALYREADAFLNVTGSQDIREEHLACPHRIYLETDPVALQIKIAQGDAGSLEFVRAHHVQFSYGENFGAPDCKVPIAHVNWIPTRQPVVLELWENRFNTTGRPYTTIATWQNKGKDIVFNGETYHWSKDREFLKFIDLPARAATRIQQQAHGAKADSNIESSPSFELALGREQSVQDLLRQHGWSWADSVDLSSNFQRYRDYIAGSRGEFTVAKDQNIRLRSGWFSDRSACYLAAGRPVITQETGFSRCLPTGQGLFAFETMDEILAAVDAIESDYDRHSRAARDLAAEYFRAETVLGKVMERAGL